MPERTGDRRADATAITQAIAHAFERLISASPADWHVFEPAWPENAG
jgi:lauroyl/myristoyl acyltransferase